MNPKLRSKVRQIVTTMSRKLFRTLTSSKVTSLSINLEVFHLLYLVFLEWEISDTNKRSSSSPPTAQALKIITLEKEIKILVFTKQSLCVITWLLELFKSLIRATVNLKPYLIFTYSLNVYICIQFLRRHKPNPILDRVDVNKTFSLGKMKLYRG